MLYPYEYFCGANVVLEIEGMPALQVAGLSLSVEETKMPIYGYSSRHFDAVARGQVLVRGSIVINYVAHDYLYWLLITAREEIEALHGQPLSVVYGQLHEVFKSQAERDAAKRVLVSDYASNLHLAQELKSKFWDTDDSALGTATTIPNPHDNFGGLDVKVTFGERSEFNNYSGATGFVLSNVYFTGRGMPIRIDEEVIVEEYPFFARNMYSIRGLATIQPTPLAQIGETLVDQEDDQVQTVGLDTGRPLAIPRYK